MPEYLGLEDSQSAAIRRACFDWLKACTQLHGDVLDRSLLEQGFRLNNEQIRVIGPQGIFKPKEVRHYPLSITTTTKGPYQDSVAPGGNLLHYAYRGTDPNFHENQRMRDAMRDQIPLVYFFSTLPGRYLVTWPVFIVGDDPGRLMFTVAVDDALALEGPRDDESPELRRAYVTREVRQRIHQRTFRDRVLRAYQQQCTVCRLKHVKMLDAAHITPDTDPDGEPVVTNGLSLCKLHHAAYDQWVFGIRPSGQIHVRRDILEEVDGPMLRHGLQEIHGGSIQVPNHKADRPDPERLEARYELFLRR